MKLKSLEIKGFKSFADKTLINLDNPVTGIVGPNGCGKSNIIDAIRWVIGEHKIKSLRSDNLEDLIFNGSKSRSTSSMAEVSLTFENNKQILPTEFSTVTVTRKFFRNGESEYRLNNVACRLKDIHNLFLDTGVSNDSYAIIELGMVDDIIKDKDGSRRRMLEQAAGISVYKARKKEAKQKLDATEGDISRIEDLLFEITNNLRSLENQAKKAERYYQIKEDYKLYSIELAKASLEEFNEKYQSLQEQLEIEEMRRDTLNAELQDDETQIENNKQTLALMEQELNVIQKAFNELLGKLRSTEGDKNLTEQRLTYLEEKEETLRDFLENSDDQLEIIQDQIGDFEDKLSDELEILETLKEKVEDLKEAVESKKELYDHQKETLEKTRTAFNQAQRQQFELEKEVAIADTSIFSLERQSVEINNEQQELNEQISRLIQEQEAAAKELAKKSALIVDLQAKKVTLQDTLKELKVSEQTLQSTLRNAHKDLDANDNEYRLIKNLIDNLEGYPESIKFLQKSNIWDTPAPLLSDLFTIAPQYRAAIEQVLDKYLNYYVVEDEQIALKAIQLLAQEEQGKANFFIANHFRGSNTAVQSVPSNWLPAYELITVKSTADAILKDLLTNVYIVDDATQVESMAIPKDCILIAANGAMVKSDKQIGGGMIGVFEGNKIGRQEQLETLQQAIEGAQKAIAEIEAQLADNKQQQFKIETDITNLPIDAEKDACHQIKIQLAQISDKITTFEERLQRNGLKIDEIDEQLNQADDQIGAIRTQLETLQAKVRDLQNEVIHTEREFMTIEMDYNLSAQQFNAQNMELTRQDGKVNAIKQELTFKMNQLNDIKQQIETNKLQLEDTTRQLIADKSKLEELAAAWQQYNEQKIVEQAQLNEKDRIYLQLRKDITEHESRIARQRRERENAVAIITSLKEQVNEMKYRVAGMKERLQVEFNVDLEVVLTEERTLLELTVEALVEETEKMKKRLDNIGEINPTAIEAYTEMKVRHDFIEEQKKDLEDARDTLLATIEEVENTANTNFKRTFDQVRENFIQVFKALFSESDNADLRMTDPDNIAETGIEIYEQPKGKRPSTLTQLSGGEKTLTSTAFLFAIYLIKPAPFCILDEVDAPLDDANVAKFTHMIRRFSDNSQFIMVTHNKQTMASVDVIYGVTMQEAGVSKIVPVDFRSLN